jgi:hypothetical protein
MPADAACSTPYLLGRPRPRLQSGAPGRSYSTRRPTPLLARRNLERTARRRAGWGGQCLRPPAGTRAAGERFGVVVSDPRPSRVGTRQATRAEIASGSQTAQPGGCWRAPPHHHAGALQEISRGRHAGVGVRVLRTLSRGRDHPVPIDVPEPLPTGLLLSGLRTSEVQGGEGPDAGAAEGRRRGVARPLPPAAEGAAAGPRRPAFSVEQRQHATVAGPAGQIRPGRARLPGGPRARSQPPAHEHGGAPRAREFAAIRYSALRFSGRECVRRRAPPTEQGWGEAPGGHGAGNPGAPSALEC